MAAHGAVRGKTGRWADPVGTTRLRGTTWAKGGKVAIRVDVRRGQEGLDRLGDPLAIQEALDCLFKPADVAAVTTAVVALVLTLR